MLKKGDFVLYEDSHETYGSGHKLSMKSLLVESVDGDTFTSKRSPGQKFHTYRIAKIRDKDCSGGEYVAYDGYDVERISKEK